MKNCKSRFDYFYGRAAEDYQFFRIPKKLVTDRRYRKVSRDAKLLYGRLLDRAALSYKNGWIDEEGRVYIIYSIKEIMEDMCCSNKTAVGFLAELDTERGIGLIEKVRKGQGEKSWIYVKDFTTDAVMPEEDDDISEVYESKEDISEVYDKEKDEKKTTESRENTEKCKNYTSRSVEPEVKKLHSQKCKNYTSKSVETTLPEVKKLHRNRNTNISNTNKVILSQSSSTLDDATAKKIKETEFIISEQTGITFDTDKTKDDNYGEEGSLIANAITAVLQEDVVSERNDRLSLLLRADRRDIENVCKKLTRYGNSVQEPLKYAETVLMNALKERYLSPPGSPLDNEPAVKKSMPRTATFDERKYSEQEWDDIEHRLLKASGYEI